MRLEFGAGLSGAQWVELVCLVAFAIAAWMNRGLLRKPAAIANAWLDRMARRPIASCAVCFALPIVLRLLLLPIYPAPEPQFHDEHSLLLQAQTFAHLHVTNPAFRPGDPLEEQYVLSRPTRQSIYPPAAAAFLAVGIVLMHSAWAAVLVEMGLLCALLCWSLRQWIPPRWAFRAALYAAGFIGVLSYWTNSYWGGSVNAIGGLMMWGALPRLRRAPRIADALVFSAGFLIALDSRPVESVIFAAIAITWLALNSARSGARIPVRVLAAASACVALGVGLNAFYNARVTGHALIPGYIAAQKTLAVPQNFYFEAPLRPVKFDFPDMRSEYERQTDLWRRGRSARGFVLAAAGKLKRAWVFFVGIALTPALLAIPFARRSRGVPLACVFIAASFAVHVFYHSYYPHYDACALGPIALVLVAGWRYLALWKPAANPFGRTLCRALPLVAVAGLIVPVAARAISGPPLPTQWYAAEFNDPAAPRKALDRFDRMPGAQLLLIHYAPDHDPNEDWIFNGPDPAKSKLVIARETGEASDTALMRRFPGRQCWIVDADATPPRARSCGNQLLAAAH